MNCIDNECKNEYSYFGESYCALTKKEIPDDLMNQMRSSVILAGALSSRNNYKCPFQNNEIIYQDLNPCSFHFSDVPECPIIDKFELMQQ